MVDRVSCLCLSRAECQLVHLDRLHCANLSRPKVCLRYQVHEKAILYVKARGGEVEGGTRIGSAKRHPSLHLSVAWFDRRSLVPHGIWESDRRIVRDLRLHDHNFIIIPVQRYVLH